MIVLSYRRADSAGFTRALRERLVRRFGAERVFVDVETIDAGEDYRQVLGRRISEAEALIVVIGPRWLEGDAGRSRLDDTDDVVRFEIATALDAGVRVVPVLVDGASMPAQAALPSDLATLAGRNAVVLTNERFEADVGELFAVLEVRGSAGRIPLIAFAAVAIAAIGWIGLYATRPWFLPGLTSFAAAAGITSLLAARSRRWPATIAHVLVPVLSLACFTLVLTAGIAIRNRAMAQPFNLVVRVLLPDGAPATALAGQLIVDIGEDRRRAPVESDGRVAFANIPGRFAGGAITVTPDFDGYENNARTVAIGTDGSVDIRLVETTPSAHFEGFVTDADRNGVANVSLLFESAPGPVTTDSTGHFEVTLPVRPGTTVRLRATLDGENVHDEFVTVPEELPLQIRIETGA